MQHFHLLFLLFISVSAFSAREPKPDQSLFCFGTLASVPSAIAFDPKEFPNIRLSAPQKLLVDAYVNSARELSISSKKHAMPNEGHLQTLLDELRIRGAKTTSEFWQLFNNDRPLFLLLVKRRAAQLGHVVFISQATLDKTFLENSQYADLFRAQVRREVTDMWMNWLEAYDGVLPTKNQALVSKGFPMHWDAIFGLNSWGTEGPHRGLHIFDSLEAGIEYFIDVADARKIPLRLLQRTYDDHHPPSRKMLDHMRTEANQLILEYYTTHRALPKTKFFSEKNTGCSWERFSGTGNFGPHTDANNRALSPNVDTAKQNLKTYFESKGVNVTDINWETLWLPSVKME